MIEIENYIISETFKLCKSWRKIYNLQKCLHEIPQLEINVEQIASVESLSFIFFFFKTQIDHIIDN